MRPAITFTTGGDFHQYAGKPGVLVKAPVGTTFAGISLRKMMFRLAERDGYSFRWSNFVRAFQGAPSILGLHYQ